MVGKLEGEGGNIVRRRRTLEGKARQDSESSGGSGSGHDDKKMGNEENGQGLRVL